MRVPEYQQSVQQQSLPNVRQTTQYTADDFLGGTQKVALQVGVDLAKSLAKDATNLAADTYKDQLKRARDARVLDASTKLLSSVQDAMYGENGALNKTGEAAFIGKNNKTVSDITYDSMLSKQREISDSLGDDEQKSMFNAHSTPMLTTMRGQLMGHEAESHRVYVKSTLEANNAAQVNNIGLNFNDSAGMRKSIDQINLNSAQLARDDGLGAEAGAVLAQTHISGALNKVVVSAIDRKDFTTAHSILKNFAPDMNTDDLAGAYFNLSKGHEAATALHTSFKTMETFKPLMQPNDGDRSFNILRGSESPTGQYPKGTKFYGLRPDGTAKGEGYLGILKRTDGTIMSEYSVGVKINGKEMDIPSIVPTLNKDEVNQILNLKDGELPSDAIIAKATAFAKSRIAKKLPVFHDTPKPVISDKGAVGAAQVMEDTGPEAAALAGLPWDRNKWMYDEEYNLAIGKAYFQRQLQENHGDLQKAYAAYNAGPGALEAAIEKGGDNWLALMPPETRAYVANNLAKFNAGEGNPTPPTKEDVVYAAINAMPPGSSPESIKDVMSSTEHLFQIAEEATKQRNESAFLEAMTLLEKNGGDINAIAPSLMRQVPVNKHKDLEDFAAGRGQGPKNSDLAVYNSLAEHPEKLYNLTPAEFMDYRNKLSEADWKHFSAQRVDHAKGSDADSPDNLDTAIVNATLNNLLIQLNIDPNPSKDKGIQDFAAEARIGTIRKYVNDSLLHAQSQTGKKFKEVEINKYITGLFAKDVALKRTVFGIEYGAPKHQPLLVTQPDEIPADVRKDIIKIFNNGGIYNPTDGQILERFFQWANG